MITTRTKPTTTRPTIKRTKNTTTTTTTTFSGCDSIELDLVCTPIV